jgi:hypothetical protein
MAEVFDLGDAAAASCRPEWPIGGPDEQPNVKRNPGKAFTLKYGASIRVV